MTLAFAVLIAITAILIVTRPRPRRRDDVPLTPAQRHQLWRARLDDEIGLDSDEYQRLLAGGIKDKRRLLAALQAIQRRSMHEQSPQQATSRTVVPISRAGTTQIYTRRSRTGGAK